MRSFILILSTIIVLGSAFAIYTMLQPSRAPSSQQNVFATTQTSRSASTTQSLRGIGSGEEAWVRYSDTGKLASEFKARKYDPQPDGTVIVEQPDANFYSSDGEQRINVRGGSGIVVVDLGPEEQPGKLQGKAMSQMPSRGRLQDVTISLFSPVDAAEPSLSVRTNNIAFNETFRVVTEAYTDAQGKRVEADEVAVVVRGDDYDFDGRGLILQWNQRDGKLQLLEIAHGESLTIKNLGTFGKSIVHSPALPMSEALVSADPRAFLLAAVTPAPPPPAAPRKKRRPLPPPPPASSRPKIVRDKSPTVYRATLERDVRIFQGKDPLAVGERMNIDLLQESSGDAETTQPTDAAPAPKRKKKPTTLATSRPAQQPIVVKWQGKLRVVPTKEPPPPSLLPGNAIVQLVGSPVLLTHEGSEVRCGELQYNSADSSGSLLTTENVPLVTMRDPDGGSVNTTRLNYFQISPTERIATLVGKGRVERPLSPEEADGKKDQKLAAAWERECRILISEDSKGESTIRRAEMSGDVAVAHPQLDMSSEKLVLVFPSSPTKPAALPPKPNGKAKKESTMPSSVIATGDVHCKLRDAAKKEQSIFAQSLSVDTGVDADGEPYPSRVHAHGDVRTSGEGREMRAGQFTATLAPGKNEAKLAAATAPPTSQPSLFGTGDMQLVALSASDDVSLTTEDGTRALAQKLDVITENGAQQYQLTGNPLASVSDGKTTISGRAIKFAPGKKLAEVVGGGELIGVAPDSKQSVKITWAGPAVVDGNTDLIDVYDQVVVTAVDEDGTVNGASAQRLRARLMPRPTTKPTASTKPANELDFLAGKDIRIVTMTGKVEVLSELIAADKSLARGLHLFAESLTYDRLTGRLEVPVAGQMLYQDHRPPAQKETAAPEGPTVGSGRGATAFRWTQSLVYDATTRQAVMAGQVEVVHEPEGKGAQPFRLNGKKLTADLEPDPAPAKNAAGAAKVAAGKEPTEKLRLRRVTVSEKVKVTSAKATIECGQLAYDPLKQLLVAVGDAVRPIAFFDHESGSTSVLSELQWNTKTDQFKLKKLSAKVQQ